MGGHDIYALGLAYPALHQLVLTRLDTDFQCDTRFPQPDWSQFEAGEAEEQHEERGIRWHVTTYTRKPEQIEKAADSKPEMVADSVVIGRS